MSYLLMNIYFLGSPFLGYLRQYKYILYLYMSAVRHTDKTAAFEIKFQARY